MAMWKNDDEMFALMKEKLYTCGGRYSGPDGL